MTEVCMRVRAAAHRASWAFKLWGPGEYLCIQGFCGILKMVLIVASAGKSFATVSDSAPE